MSGKGRSSTPAIRVIIVDDLAQVREELVEILRLTTGVEVVGSASDGLNALQLSEQLNPDIVIMDAELPGMNGFEATRQIKARRLAVGVIMLSIHDRLKNLHRAEEAGVDAYIEKGEGIRVLIKAIFRVWREKTDSSAINQRVDP